MNIKPIVSFFCILFPFMAFGQITLTQSSYPATVLGSDSLKRTATGTAFPALSPAAGGMWDLSGVTDTTPNFFSHHVAVSGYTYADSNRYGISGFGYQGNVLHTINASGILESGIRVLGSNYSLTAITLGPIDSLFIDNQNITYSSARKVIAFPATYNSSWNSTYRADLNFEITVALAGYTHTPCIARKYYTEWDTVSGWGKMRVKDATGSPTAYLDVLQIQAMVVTVDSYFANGLPASPLILSPLSLTQGKRDTVYEQRYCRPMEVTPLATVVFRDAARTQPMRAIVHSQRLLAVSVPSSPPAHSISVFPNPAQNTVSIDGLETKEVYTYAITDMVGRMWPLDQVALDAGKAIVTIPDLIPEGNYTLSVMKNGSSVYVQQIKKIK